MSTPSSQPASSDAIRARIAKNVRVTRAMTEVDGHWMRPADLRDAMTARGFTSWRHQETVRRAELGLRRLYAEEIVALADVFGVPVSELLGTRP